MWTFQGSPGRAGTDTADLGVLSSRLYLSNGICCNVNHIYKEGGLGLCNAYICFYRCMAKSHTVWIWPNVDHPPSIDVHTVHVLLCDAYFIMPAYVYIWQNFALYDILYISIKNRMQLVPLQRTSVCCYFLYILWDCVTYLIYNEKQPGMIG